MSLLLTLCGTLALMALYTLESEGAPHAKLRHVVFGATLAMTVWSWWQMLREASR